MKDLFSLDGKVAVVTGAFGLLGRQMSAALARYGARVAALDVVPTPPEGGPPGWQHGLLASKIRPVRADVTSRADLEAALAEISGAWNVPSVLVNAAAIDSPPDAPASENGPFETYPEASLDRVIAVNVKGTWIACQVFGGAMARAGRGSIVNVASTYGLVSPNQDLYAHRRAGGEDWYKPAAYATTKSALLNLTRYLATYWARRGVRVNTLVPGGVSNGQDPAFLAEYAARVPMGRMAEPDELDGAVVFLASDSASYVTGSTLVVDGGWTAW